MKEQIIIAIIGVLGGGTVVAIIAAFRFRKKDSATAKKISAEADAIIMDNFQSLLKTYQDENRLLQVTVNELKMEVLKLREQVNKLNAG